MAAAAGAVSVAVGGVDWSSFVGAAALVAAALTELYLVRDRPDRRWYEGRAAAESAKTLGWRYAVGAEPFGVEALSGRDADLLLIQRLDEVLTDLDDLATEPPRGRAERSPRRCERCGRPRSRSAGPSTSAGGPGRRWSGTGPRAPGTSAAPASADAWDSSSAGETAMSMASHFLSCARISSHHAWPPLSRSSTQT